MTTRPLPLRTGYDYERSSEFGYACAACGRCCKDKVIPINPYEVLRIARHLGTTTTDVIARYTDGGSALKNDEAGTCVFFGDRGCSVHPARPLACRLYPLGRYRAPDGTERFAEVEPHAESAGRYGLAGKVSDYLAAQGAGPYIEQSDRYLALLERMIAVLAAHENADDASDEVEGEQSDLDDWLDIDGVVGRHCSARCLPVPQDLEQLVACHIEAVRSELDRLGQPAGATTSP